MKIKLDQQAHSHSQANQEGLRRQIVAQKVQNGLFLNSLPIMGIKTTKKVDHVITIDVNSYDFSDSDDDDEQPC